MKKILLSLLCALSLSFIAHSQSLTKLWASDTTLKVPESVLIDAKNERMFVSNIDGKGPWDRDGKGSIALLTMSGKIINPEWVKGLNSPKGMAMVQDFLVVADVDSILIIDIARATVVKKIGIEGAQGFNDITATKSGDIYVSDSKTKKIHMIRQIKSSLVLDSLKGPNGVLYVDRTLYFVDAGSFYKLGKNNQRILIAEGMEGNTDGIEQVDENTFIVSCWAGVVWLIKLNGDALGEKKLLLDTRNEGINTADIAFDKKTKILYVPTFWKNNVVAYQLK
jgi:sugar lactone lactonase YvrE